MTDAPVAAGFSNGTPAQSSPAPRKQELARALDQKRAEGFEVESESATQAVLVMKGRRRWFGLSDSASVRYEVSVDEGGRAKSRRLSG